MASLNVPGGDKQTRVLLDQINARTSQRAIVGRKFPSDLKSGDGTTRLDGDAIHIGQSDGKSVKEFKISRAMTQFVGLTSSAAAPTTAELASDGDWGWHFDTATSLYYVARNAEGVIVYPAFASIAGSITAAQHGNMAAGGSLHAAATGSVSGFMSAADKTILDAATSANTVSTIAKRDANGNITLAGTLNAVVTKTTTYTATLANSIIICDSAAGAFTITLPTAVGCTGKMFTFIKTNAVGNIVTIDGSGAQTINGTATITFFTQWDVRIIVSNGANWLVIGTI